MAFSDYKTVSQVQAEYRIKYEEHNFIAVKEHEIPEAFVREFEFNRENMDIFSSEAARCEIIIFPVLREMYKNYYKKISLWVQKPIVCDEKLSGTPDYILSKKSELGKTMLEFPLVIVAEAKKNDFEQGWAQCLAGLIAARCLNTSSQLPVYGIVTDGKLWEFGKLTENVFTKNTDCFTVTDMNRLFGALRFVFDDATALV